MTLLITSLLGSESTSSNPREALAGQLGYDFADPANLDLSLRHRSWCAENGGVSSNERLEFLGDAVVGLVVTDHLYRRAPLQSEGTLARNRSEVVSSSALAEIARSINLGDALLLGKGELATGGRDKTSILADTLEAVVGAVFLDGGLQATEAVILRVFRDRLDAVIDGDLTSDFKSRLQELSARDFGELPDYHIDHRGPEHRKRFSATVVVGGQVRGLGEGRTKKAAEQDAAQSALEVWTANSAAGPDVDLADAPNVNLTIEEEEHA